MAHQWLPSHALLSCYALWRVALMHAYLHVYDAHATFGPRASLVCQTVMLGTVFLRLTCAVIYLELMYALRA